MPGPDRDIFGRTPRAHANWDHRRGEPRTFALVWTIFLMLATLVMFSTLGAAHTVTIDIYRPAVRALLVTITAGMVLLWPMMRLSQEAPIRGIGASIAKDLAVVLIPTQALVWPQALRMLGGWPIGQTAALASCQAAWAVLVGGLLALALATDARPRELMRGLWMLAIVAIVILVPLVEILFGALRPLTIRGPEPAMMASPLLAVVELLRDRGVASPVATFASDWRAIGITSLAGAGLWMLAFMVEVARRPGRA
ncbi:MAG: hypothetical protein DYG94_14450 [Leptolyngbya sp. PLA3]|nr:MAG: hypothetical protein EDM82_14705 [Cyanobacteria bacterium CYA]MCE7969929.1 hypothetical protein [Leptolyngbya sp. PL-A3]